MNQHDRNAHYDKWLQRYSNSFKSIAAELQHEYFISSLKNIAPISMESHCFVCAEDDLIQLKALLDAWQGMNHLDQADLESNESKTQEDEPNMNTQSATINQNQEIPTIYIYYYGFDAVTNTCKWGLTDSLKEAQAHDVYEVASIDDLHDMIAAGGDYYTFPVRVKEGIVQFNETGTWDEELIDAGLAEEYSCGYELTGDECIA